MKKNYSSSTVIFFFFLLNCGIEVFINLRGMSLPFSHVWLTSLLFICFFLLYWTLKNDYIELFIHNLFAVKGRAELFYLLFLSWAFITAPFSIDPIQSYKRIGSFLIIYVTFNKLFGMMIKSKEGLITLFKSLYLVLFVFIVLNLILIIKAPDRFFSTDVYFNPAIDSGRTGGIWGAKSLFGFYSMIFVILSYLLIKNRALNIIICCLNISLGLIGLFISGSRTVLIASFAGWLFFTILVLRNFRKSEKIRLSIAILVPVVIFILGYYHYDINFTDFLLRGYQRGDVSASRIDLWNSLLPIAWKERPLMGYGIGTSQLFMSEFGWQLSGMMNSFVDIFVTTGLVGTVLFTCFIFMLCKQIYILYKLSDKNLWGTILLLIFTIVVASLTEQTLDVPSGLPTQIVMLILMASNGRFLRTEFSLNANLQRRRF